jgi:methyl-accepting chemotaxis protein
MFGNKKLNNAALTALFVSSLGAKAASYDVGSSFVNPTTSFGSYDLTDYSNSAQLNSNHDNFLSASRFLPKETVEVISQPSAFDWTSASSNLINLPNVRTVPLIENTIPNNNQNRQNDQYFDNSRTYSTPIVNVPAALGFITSAFLARKGYTKGSQQVARVNRRVKSILEAADQTASNIQGNINAASETFNNVNYQINRTVESFQAKSAKAAETIDNSINLVNNVVKDVNNLKRNVKYGALALGTTAFASGAIAGSIALSKYIKRKKQLKRLLKSQNM